MSRLQDPSSQANDVWVTNCHNSSGCWWKCRLTEYMISEGLAKMTLSFLVSDANDIDTKEEGEEKDEDALSFPIHL